jgi:hypothetical protein
LIFAANCGTVIIGDFPLFCGIIAALHYPLHSESPLCQNFGDFFVQVSQKSKIFLLTIDKSIELYYNKVDGRDYRHLLLWNTPKHGILVRERQRCRYEKTEKIESSKA